MQEIRIGHRREAIQEETDAKQEVKGLKRKYIPYTFENGDTRKELLARRRHLLFKSLKSGVNHRKSEPKILFKKYSVHQKSIMSGFRDASARMQTKIPRADGIAPLPRDKRPWRITATAKRKQKKRISPSWPEYPLLPEKKAATYSPALQAVPSAWAGLTSLFGMGRGGTPLQ